MSLTEELARLAAMHEAGHLSNGEFSLAKQAALRSFADGPALDTQAEPAVETEDSARSEETTDLAQCPSCGESLEPGRAFCDTCGSRKGLGGGVPRPPSSDVQPSPFPGREPIQPEAPSASGSPQPCPAAVPAPLEVPLSLDRARLVFERALCRFNDGRVSWDADTATLSGRVYWMGRSYPACLHLCQFGSSTVAELDVPKADPKALPSIRTRFAETLLSLDDPAFAPNKTGAGSWANFWAASPKRRALMLMSFGGVLVLLFSFATVSSRAGRAAAFAKDLSNGPVVGPLATVIQARREAVNSYDPKPDAIYLVDGALVSVTVFAFNDRETASRFVAKQQAVDSNVAALVGEQGHGIYYTCASQNPVLVVAGTDLTSSVSALAAAARASSACG